MPVLYEWAQSKANQTSPLKEILAHWSSSLELFEAKAQNSLKALIQVTTKGKLDFTDGIQWFIKVLRSWNINKNVFKYGKESERHKVIILHGELRRTANRLWCLQAKFIQVMGRENQQPCVHSRTNWRRLLVWTPNRVFDENKVIFVEDISTKGLSNPRWIFISSLTPTQWRGPFRTVRNELSVKMC